MKDEVKAEWVAALRSGNYQQGRTSLRNENDEYCCLGVLCDITKLGDWQNTTPIDNQNWSYTYEGKTSYCLIHPPLAKKLGLDENRAGELMLMNDRGDSFAKIANYIERNVH